MPNVTNNLLLWKLMMTDFRPVWFIIFGKQILRKIELKSVRDFHECFFTTCLAPLGRGSLDSMDPLLRRTRHKNDKSIHT
jgi:hypothetical protein